MSQMSRLWGIALLGLANLCSAQMAVLSRSSSINYSYTHGGGPDIHFNSNTVTDTSTPPNDFENVYFYDSTSGTQGQDWWNTNVNSNMNQSYTAYSNPDGVHSLFASGQNMLTTSAMGTLGIADFRCVGPGNTFQMVLDVPQAIDFRLRGMLENSRPGNAVRLERWNGSSWITLFDTALVGTGWLSFDEWGTLGATQHRVTAVIAGAIDGTEVEGISYLLELDAINITAQINLLDYMQTLQGEGASIGVWRNGSPIGGAYKIVGPNGTVGIYTPETGDITLKFKSRTGLTRAVDVSMSSGPITGLTVDLINGDVDQDDEVGPGDFGRLSAAFGATTSDPNWDIYADLDGDAEVGPSDFGILSANFGLTGD